MKIIPDAMRRPAEIERDELRRRLQALEEREAACCPEDVPFDEYIRALGEQLARARAEIERKDKLIDQLKNCYNCKFELHVASECETCNTADCDDSYQYETSNWQPKEPEAAERGE